MTLDAKPYDVVLHIGGPKTGSSALQNFFLNNRKQLADVGYYYPEHGFDINGISGGHSSLGISLRDKKKASAERMFGEFINEAKSQCKTLLLSSESYYGYPEEFKALTDGLNCRIVCFFREPTEFIVSIYNQSVKRHYNTAKLEEYCNHVLKVSHNQASGMLIYKWAEYFEMENTSVLRYQKPQFADANLEKLFLSELGVGSERQGEFRYNSKPINRAYNESILEFKRRLNHVIDKDSKSQNNKIDHILQSISDAQSADRIDNVATQVLKDAYVLLDAKFKDSNEKICNDFFQGEKASVTNELVVSQVPSFSLLQFAEYVEAIKTSDEQVDAYIRRCIEKKLRVGGGGYYVLSLAEAYGIGVDNLIITPVKKAQQSGFNNELVKQVLENSNDPGVLLKVIAIALERQGKFRQAFSVITKASQAGGAEDVVNVLSRIKKNLSNKIP